LKTKPNDIPYCGVRSKKISQAQPVLDWTMLKYLNQFIKRRYGIHLRKDVLHEPAPWTKDKILQEFRFTNVRREHDKETLWLIHNIVQAPHLSYGDKLLNIILFRIFNKHETAELLRMPIRFSERENWNPERYRQRFEDARLVDPKRIFFTGAFITGGTKRALKWYLPDKRNENSMEMRVMYFMKYLIDTGFVSELRKVQKQDQQAVFQKLNSTMGIGEFLGYQIFVDFSYIPEFPFSENEFVVAGPGCSKGLKYLFRDTDHLTDEECLFWLRDHIDDLFHEIDPDWNPQRFFWDLPEYDRCLNVMSLENCFCEFSKYIRAKLGTGRPRKKYMYKGENNG